MADGSQACPALAANSAPEPACSRAKKKAAESVGRFDRPADQQL